MTTLQYIKNIESIFNGNMSNLFTIYIHLFPEPFKILDAWKEGNIIYSKKKKKGGKKENQVFTLQNPPPFTKKICFLKKNVITELFSYRFLPRWFRQTVKAW